MSKNTDSGLVELNDLKADRLRDVAYSAGIDTEGASKKVELIERLEAADVGLGPDGWTKAGDTFDVEERPTRSTEPSDTTLLYAFKREATPGELVDAMGSFVEERGLELREGTTGSGKETLTIVRPVEAQTDEMEQSDDMDVPTCAGTKANGEPCTREVEEPGAYCHQHGPDQ